MDGKVALITGAARGQGRSHAVRLAQEGADIIAIDRCESIPSVPYPLATEEDLAETARLVQQEGRRVVVEEVDVRDTTGLRQAVDQAVDGLGQLDTVCCNAGILSMGTIEEMTDEAWQDMIDVNLTGYRNTAKATIPHLREGGRGGSITMTSSVAGLEGFPNIGHYDAAKHGVVGLMKTLAMELADDMIRVNSLHPTQVDTDMVQNEPVYRRWNPDDPTAESFRQASQEANTLPVPWVDSVAAVPFYRAGGEAAFWTRRSARSGSAGRLHPAR